MFICINIEYTVGCHRKNVFPSLKILRATLLCKFVHSQDEEMRYLFVPLPMVGTQPLCLVDIT